MRGSSYFHPPWLDSSPTHIFLFPPFPQPPRKKTNILHEETLPLKYMVGVWKPFCPRPRKILRMHNLAWKICPGIRKWKCEDLSYLCPDIKWQRILVFGRGFENFLRKVSVSGCITAHYALSTFPHSVCLPPDGIESGKKNPADFFIASPPPPKSHQSPTTGRGWRGKWALTYRGNWKLGLSVLSVIAFICRPDMCLCVW